MRILTGTRSIRAKIKNLLSDPEDERVVAVAYVGTDALSFLPDDPSGLTLYCWPQAGGTNPYAVQQLRDAEVEVRFVKRLHAKVYWSRTRGALIGSANLTTNALGEQALQEAAVWVPPGAFDMDSFTKSLKVEADFADTLKRLHEAHVRFSRRNPPPGRPPVGRPKVLASFPQWMDREGRAEWRLGWYEEDADAPEDAINELENTQGTREFATFLGVTNTNNLKKDIPTLGFLVYENAGVTKISDLDWWVPIRQVPSTAKAWKDYVIWFAGKRRVHVGAEPPFNARDRRFRRALEATIQELGIPKLREEPRRPSSAFLKMLRQHY